MPTPEDVVQQLYNLSSKLYYCLEKIDADMDRNDPVEVERLLELVEQRGLLIQEASAIIPAKTDWSANEQQKLAQMKEWEVSMQEKLQSLYTSFSKQFHRLKQGKQTAKSYNDSYTGIYTDGVYIDKRK